MRVRNPLAPHDPRDPRDWVTPDDLNVAPDLLGAPLAKPHRRLFAIGVDVVIVAMLSNLGNLWLLAGLALIAVVHLRVSKLTEAPQRKWLAWAIAAALIAIGVVQWWTEGGEHKPRHALRHHITVDDADELPAAVPGLTPLQSAEAKIAVLQAELAAARKPKGFDLHEQISRWADDVGLGLGWTIAYFALLPAWWNGQTVGKRLFGLRVVELTGKPLTVMRAFKRYGGYAAGMATGLFGFLQVFWDPNRQAIQDKTAHTVVIDLRRKLAGPAQPAPSEEPR